MTYPISIKPFLFLEIHAGRKNSGFRKTPQNENKIIQKLYFISNYCKLQELAGCFIPSMTFRHEHLGVGHICTADYSTRLLGAETFMHQKQQKFFCKKIFILFQITVFFKKKLFFKFFFNHLCFFQIKAFLKKKTFYYK